MQESAADFVERLPQGINVGLVSFAGAAAIVQTPTIDRNAIKVAIEGLELDQATATGEAIFACLQSIKTFQQGIADEEGKVPAARIILLSDGYRTVGRDVSTAVDAAKEAKIPVSTIAFGSDGGTIENDGEQIPVPVDLETMQMIAEDTGGTYFNAESAGEIEKVWEDIGEQIGYTFEFKEIPTRFVGYGLLLAFASVAMSLLWSNRLL
jgi:Ca-activated chloride channel family protein